MVSVTAVAPTFAFQRVYIAAGIEKVFVNDTFVCRAQHGSRCALYTNHTVVFHTNEVTVRLNGGFDAPQLDECETNIVRGTNGNPSVVAWRDDVGGGLGHVA